MFSGSDRQVDKKEISEHPHKVASVAGGRRFNSLADKENAMSVLNCRFIEQGNLFDLVFVLV